MNNRKIFAALNRAVISVAGLTTHGASSSAYLSACASSAPKGDTPAHPQAHGAAESIAGKRRHSMHGDSNR